MRRHATRSMLAMIMLRKRWPSTSLPLARTALLQRMVRCR